MIRAPPHLVHNGMTAAQHIPFADTTIGLEYRLMLKSRTQAYDRKGNYLIPMLKTPSLSSKIDHCMQSGEQIT